MQHDGKIQLGNPNKDRFEDGVVGCPLLSDCER
jgi:hypothetical protein